MSSVVRMKQRVSTFYLCVVDNKCAELSDLLPGIMNQLGPDNIDHLKQLADNLSNSNKVPVWVKSMMMVTRTSPILLRISRMLANLDYLSWKGHLAASLLCGSYMAGHHHVLP